MLSGVEASAPALPSRARLLAELDAHGQAIAFDRDGRRLAIVRDGHLGFLAGDGLHAEPPLPGRRVVAKRGFAPVLAASHGELVVVGHSAFDSATGRELVLPPPRARQCSDASSQPTFPLSGARASMSCLGEGEAVFVFDTATGRRLRVLALPARAGLPEGGALTASGDHVKVTERGVGKFVEVRTLAESLDYGSQAVRSPRDGFIFTRPGQRLEWFGQGESSAPQLVRSSDGSVVYELPAWVDTVRFSASDRLFVALVGPRESQGDLSVWATSSPTPLMRVPCDLNEVADARFSLDDTRLAVLTKQGHVLLYALE